MQAAGSVEQNRSGSAVVQALNWARCQPGILLLGALALAALVTKPGAKSEMPAGRRLETEADLVDGEDPLFI